MEYKETSVEKKIKLCCKEYQPPLIEVLEVVVEQGFASTSIPSTPPSSAPEAGGTGGDLPWG